MTHLQHTNSKCSTYMHNFVNVEISQTVTVTGRLDQLDQSVLGGFLSLSAVIWVSEWVLCALTWLYYRRTVSMGTLLPFKPPPIIHTHAYTFVGKKGKKKNSENYFRGYLCVYIRRLLLISVLSIYLKWDSLPLAPRKNIYKKHTRKKKWFLQPGKKMRRQLAFIRIFHGWTREEREREWGGEKERKQGKDGWIRSSLSN